MNDSSERYSLDDYDFDLPEDLIAQQPASRREGSRLLFVPLSAEPVQHQAFTDLIDHLNPGDLLVINKTKVIPARIFGEREKTKGKAEVLLVAPTENGWDFLLKTRGKPDLGETFLFADGQLTVTLEEKGERGRWRGALTTASGSDPLSILEEVGTMPLPPYIKRDQNDEETAQFDRERYQTVFAEVPGAVAAPTAGLHFTDSFFAQLAEKGIKTASVTLHVGLGTFQPIEAEDFRDHDIHAEIFEVPVTTADMVNRTRQQGGRVVAVGTTSLRSLESAWDEEKKQVLPRSGTTRLFIYPPQQVRSIDSLVTNFHLPRSSLMLLVSAFAGREKIMDAYRQAIEERYRFFSYGDAMLIM
ncbi:MAG: S-adenosylmethionine:tRNA ribosyltransferase-isomerase [Planctomycetota bacterium]